MNPVLADAPAPRATPLVASHALSDLPQHTPAVVCDVLEPGSLGERLLEMGLTPGTPVHVVRRGLLGDPLQIAVRGTMLSLRRAQARRIAVMRL